MNTVALCRRDISNFEHALAEAQGADETMERKLERCSGSLELLTYEALAKNEPVLERPMVTTVNIDDEISRSRNKVNELHELASQRASIEQCIRDVQERDDILPRLISTANESQEALFTEELKKYDTFSHQIQQNEYKQAEVLHGLKVSTDQLASAFDIDVCIYSIGCTL